LDELCLLGAVELVVARGLDVARAREDEVAHAHVHSLVDGIVADRDEVGHDAVARDRIRRAVLNLVDRQLVERPRAGVWSYDNSKNGTFWHGERVTSSQPLTSGDAVGFGSVRAVFFIASPDRSTETAHWENVI
jgi:hypothetical protein